MTFDNAAGNGQLAAAAVTFIDGLFGLLVVVHVVSVAPAESLVTAVVAVALNVAGAVLALIQHSQSVTKAKLASAERMAAMAPGAKAPK